MFWPGILLIVGSLLMCYLDMLTSCNT